MPGEKEIAALLKAARAGRAEAVNRLFEIFRGYLRRLARDALESPLNAKRDPSDIVQETLLRAHLNLHRFKGESRGQFLGWLRRILSRHVIDLTRSYRAAASRDVARERPLEDSACGDRSPDEAVAQREASDLLTQALADLPEDHRRVVVLRDLEQRSWKEVGERMHRSAEAARLLHRRAIARLRTALR